MDQPPHPGDLVDIPSDECIELLEAASYVRVGFVHEQLPDVLPVNHLLHDGAIYFRTAPGSKLGSAAADSMVAVETDEADDARRIGWSVVAHGRASIVTDEAEIEALLAYPFEPWALPEDRDFWVRVDVHTLTGRRLLRR